MTEALDYGQIIGIAKLPYVELRVFVEKAKKVEITVRQLAFDIANDTEILPEQRLAIYTLTLKMLALKYPRYDFSPWFLNGEEYYKIYGLISVALK